jgi:hypothetical protein
VFSCFFIANKISWNKLTYTMSVHVTFSCNFYSFILISQMVHPKAKLRSNCVIAYLFWDTSQKYLPIKGKIALCLTTTWRSTGSGCTGRHFLCFGTSWRWVVSFKPLPFSPRRKSPRFPLGRRLGGPQSRCGRYGQMKILYSTGTRTPTALSSIT